MNENVYTAQQEQDNFLHAHQCLSNPEYAQWFQEIISLHKEDECLPSPLLIQLHKEGYTPQQVYDKLNPKDKLVFAGFEPSNTTPVPDVIFDELLTELSNSELRVILYIVRRTYGFKKVSDAISFNQFLNGITTKDGKVLDKGCGIKNRTVLSKTLNDMENRGYINATKGKDPQGDKSVTIYSLRFRPQGVVSKTYHLPEGGSVKNVPQVVQKTYQGGIGNVPGVVSETYLQETVIQQTELQETVIQQENRANETETSTAAPVVALTPSSLLSSEEKTKATEELSTSEAVTPSRARAAKPRIRKEKRAEPPQKVEPLLSEKARVVWDVWLQMPWNKEMAPSLTEIAAAHCEKLSTVEITVDILLKVRNFANKNDNNGFYKGKAWTLGNVVNEYSKWRSAEYTELTIQSASEKLNEAEKKMTIADLTKRSLSSLARL